MSFQKLVFRAVALVTKKFWAILYIVLIDENGHFPPCALLNKKIKIITSPPPFPASFENSFPPEVW